MVNFCGIFHVTPAISKYVLRYKQISITLKKNTSFNKNNDVSNMYVNKLYALKLLHYNLQIQHLGVFPLISNALVTLAGR